MTKIMLVEDDNNLREIYEARLAAEGYSIVSAQDGEAALALAAKERPDLIITDVMMPKISGFEMLDILRNTENLRDVKVIMLTALGQAEDNARAGALGADRYLVKSQVTLEDIVKATHEVLEPPIADDTAASTPPVASPAAPATADTQTVQDQADGSTVTPGLIVTPETIEAQTDTVNDFEPTQAVITDDTVTSPIIDVAEPPSALAPSPLAAQLDLPDVPIESDRSDVVDTAASEPISGSASDQAVDSTVVSDHGASTVTPTDTGHVAQQYTDTAVTAAAPAAEEESIMRSQIDQFLENIVDGSPAAPPSVSATTQPADPTDSATSPVNIPAEPVETPTLPESEESTDNDVAYEPILDLSQNSSEDVSFSHGEVNIGDRPPSDEADSEYDKDASSPDMGQLAVHVEAAPATENPGTGQPETPRPATTPVTQPEPQPESEPAESQPEPAVATSPQSAYATPGYPSQPYELPITPDAAITPESSTGDKLVSDAIENMSASTTDRAPLTPVPSAVNDHAEPGTDTSGVTQAPPVEASATSSQNSDGSVHKRVISPLGLPPRPDIHQLLAMEDAKVAASQAGSYQQAPATTQPGQQPASLPQPPMQPNAQIPYPQANQINQPGQQPWQPQPIVAQPPQNNYNSSIDPNSISL